MSEVKPVVAGKDPRDRFANLIVKFGAGWEAGDAKAIAAVFTEDCSFVADPHRKPITGRAGVESYWADVPKEQAEIKFRFGEVHQAGPWFAVEYKCTYRRRRTGEPVVVKGALFCEIDDDLISEMRMYWHRRTRK